MARGAGVSDLVLKLVSEHGPWVLLVFYLLWRDLEKDKLARTLIDKNTAILVEFLKQVDPVVGCHLSNHLSNRFERLVLKYLELFVFAEIEKYFTT